MIDPCAVTVLDAYPIADMQVSIFGTAAIQTLTTLPTPALPSITKNSGTPLDSVAKIFGDKTGTTYCGGKTITITGSSPAAPAWNQYLTLDTTSDHPKFTL